MFGLAPDMGPFERFFVVKDTPRSAVLPLVERCRSHDRIFASPGHRTREDPKASLQAPGTALRSWAC